MNKLPWFTHDHNSHRDLWMREMIRKHGHRFHTLYWTLLELLHEHGIGDELTINWRDLEEATMLRRSKVRSIVTATDVATKIETRCNDVAITFKIKKFRERQSKLKSNLPSTFRQPSVNLPIERERERERELLNEAELRNPSKFHEFMDWYLNRFEGLEPKNPDPQKRKAVSAAYSRFGKYGSEVLAFAENDVELAKNGVDGISRWVEACGGNWNLSTVSKWFTTWKQGGLKNGQISRKY